MAAGQRPEMAPSQPDFDYLAGNEAGEISGRLLPPQLAECLLGFEAAWRSFFCKAGSESPRAYRFVTRQGSSSRPNSGPIVSQYAEAAGQWRGGIDENFQALQDIFSAGIGAGRVCDIGATQGTAQAARESRACQAGGPGGQTGPRARGSGSDARGTGSRMRGRCTRGRCPGGGRRLLISGAAACLRIISLDTPITATSPGRVDIGGTKSTTDATAGGGMWEEPGTFTRNRWMGRLPMSPMLRP